MADNENIPQLYKNNPNLKAAGVNMEFEPWQVQEIIKCYHDPIYFVQNYVKIVHIDRGLVPFELYEYQKGIVKTVADNRFVIMRLPRQSGKCVKGDTTINIRNKSTGEVRKIAIGEFYEWHRFRKQARSVVEGHNVST